MASDTEHALKRRALGMILRPIARFCLRHGLTIQDFTELGKVALVEAAERTIAATEQKANSSRISVVTGLQRREVNRIRENGAAVESIPLNLAGRVLGQWEQDPRFTNKDKSPSVLECSSPNSRFHELVRAVTRNVNPASVLAELQRMGAIEISARGARLLKRGGDFSQDRLGATELLAKDIETLTECVEENIAPGSHGGNLHIRTEYDNIYLKDLPKVRQWLMDRGKEFHRSAREFLAMHDKDVTPAADPHEPAGGKVQLQAFSLITSPSRQ